MVLGTKAEDEMARKAGRRSGAQQVETLSNIYDSARVKLKVKLRVKLMFLMVLMVLDGF